VEGDIDYLVTALKDPEHRFRAARYLGDFADDPEVRSRALPPLLRLLDAADPHVRTQASVTLGRLGALEVAPRLRELALDDPVPWVRSWAIGALRELGDEGARSVVIRSLADDDWRVRRSAIHALGALGGPESIEALKKAQRSDRWFRRRYYRRALRRLRVEIGGKSTATWASVFSPDADCSALLILPTQRCRAEEAFHIKPLTLAGRSHTAARPPGSRVLMRVRAMTPASQAGVSERVRSPSHSIRHDVDVRVIRTCSTGKKSRVAALIRKGQGHPPASSETLGVLWGSLTERSGISFIGLANGPEAPGQWAAITA
jgi:hypothetical protein